MKSARSFSMASSQGQPNQAFSQFERSAKWPTGSNTPVRLAFEEIGIGSSIARREQGDLDATHLMIGPVLEIAYR